ncbi:hypothetical protein HGRIS_010774 [Hohenbuehelia grisea]|uniref:Uncharacterized protein n=1 Tax=Hohenbuehelia grisea TaxID=104357 RepID=A0ABR3IY07_9AGAR
MPFVSIASEWSPTSTILSTTLDIPSTTSSAMTSIPNTIPRGSNEAKLYISAIVIMFLGGVVMAVLVVRRLMQMRKMKMEIKTEGVEGKDLEVCLMGFLSMDRSGLKILQKQGDGVKESVMKRLRAYLNKRWNIFSGGFTAVISELSPERLLLSLNKRWNVFSGWFTPAVSEFFKRNSPPVQQELPEPTITKRRRRSSFTDFVYHLPCISPFRLEIEAWKRTLIDSRTPCTYMFIDYDANLLEHEIKLKEKAPMELYYLRIKLLRKLRIRKEKRERMADVPEPVAPKGVARAPSEELYTIFE